MSSRTPDFQLIHAIKFESPKFVIDTIDAGGSIDAIDVDGLSLLEIAQARSRHDLVQILVQRGADPNAIVGKKGDRLLHRSTRTGDFGFTVALLENGADVHAANSDGMTPILLSVQNQHYFITQHLLEKGASVGDSTVHAGNQPIHLASLNNDASHIKLLVEHKANPNARNKTGHTPLDIATMKGKSNAIRRLLEYYNPQLPTQREIITEALAKAKRYGHEEAATILSESCGAVLESKYTPEKPPRPDQAEFHKATFKREK